MSIFWSFKDKLEEYTVSGKSNELLALTRRGRSQSASVMNNNKQALLQDDTKITTGDLVTNVKTGVQYLIQAKQSSTDANYAQLCKVNCTVDIQRLAKHYTNGNFDYYTVANTMLDVPASYKEVTGKMQQFDLGLKSDTTIEFIMQITDVKLNDRIVFNGNNLIITVVNTSKYEGLYSIQCKPDDGRVVK